MSDEMLNLRIVEAIERVWKSVLEIREFAYQYVHFQSYLFPHEYKNILVGKGRKTVPEMSQQEFYLRVREITSDVETVRPLVGETIWSLYNIYTVFVMRQAVKVLEGLEKGKLFAWNKDFEGKPDSLTQNLLSNIFSEQELTELNGSDGLGTTARITGTIETKILNEMNDWIFNRNFHKPDFKKQQSILNSTINFNVDGDLINHNEIIKEGGAMSVFDQKNQKVETQYNAAGNINFESVTNRIELVAELGKLKSEIIKAVEIKAINSETATDVEYKLTKAVLQSQKPQPDKKLILENINGAITILGGISSAVNLVAAFIKAAELVEKFF